MFRSLVALCLILMLALLPEPAPAEVTGRVRVIDGDTLDVGPTRVRLHGIDAPEGGQPCTTNAGISWDCGGWVTATVRERYDRKTARCDRIDTDRYGRVVARCTIDGQDIGQALVRDGLALAYRKYSMAYDPDEKRAAVKARGVHAGQMQTPAEYRRAQSTAEKASRGVANDCAIKGNISTTGTQIYHVPGQRDYARTVIRADKGERWFCSASAAQAAGWRAARR